MGERGVTVAHATLHRWGIKYAPEVEKEFRHRQRPVGRSWRLDETYEKIKGKAAYLYRAVDKAGQTIAFLLPPTRDRDAADAFLRKALRNQGAGKDHDRPEWQQYGSDHTLQHDARDRHYSAPREISQYPRGAGP